MKITKLFLILILILINIQSQQLSSSEINRLKMTYDADGNNLKEYVEEEKEEVKEKKRKPSLDTTKMIMDSLVHLVDSLKNEEPSVFEKISMGIEINPDSILKTIKVFGHSTFNNKTNTKNLINSSVPSNYIIAPGDEIIVNLWGRINENHKLKVKRDGTIDLPRVGPIKVSGITFKSVKKNIENEIAKINGVNSSVSIGTISDINIYIVGEVNTPGKHTVPALSSITDLLIYAGGFNKTGSLRNIKVKRGNSTVKNIDLYKLLLSGNNFSNFRFLSGDVIHVPVASNMVTIAGNVKRSAIYELKGKSNSLTDLINLSGGFLATAWNNRIQLNRYNNNNEKKIYDLNPDSLSFKLQDGDIIKIYPIHSTEEKLITIEGNVKRPGKFEFKEGMKLNDIINSYDFLEKDTYLKYAIIYRINEKGQKVHLIPFNLDSIIQNPSYSNNLELKNRDKVVIYNRDFFEPERIISIGGAVTQPGDYNLFHNMHIKDLVLASGGLNISASSIKGELYRRTFISDSVHTKKIDFNIQLAMEGDENNNHLLEKDDHIFIRNKRGWGDKKTITLIGEFNFPGEYVILENETLGDVLERAGGFKSNAYLEGSIFTRNSVKDLEVKRTIEYADNLEKEMFALSSAMLSKGTIGTDALALIEHQKAMLQKLRDFEPVGRLVIDLTDNNSYLDIQLENGDTLYTPTKTNMVSVIGEVFNPATFVLSKNRSSASRYIEAAGGYMEMANKKDVYVIKADGSVLTKKMVNIKRYPLLAGDVIVVPKKLPQKSGAFNAFMNTLTVIERLTAITSNTVTTIAAIEALKNSKSN